MENAIKETREGLRSRMEGGPFAGMAETSMDSRVIFRLRVNG